MRDDPHSDNRRGGNRCSVATTAAPLRAQVGALRGSGLYNALGRPWWMDLPLARLSLYAPSALRRSVCGATMTTPGGAGTTLRPHARLPVLGAPASLIRSEFPRTGLRPFVVNRNICNFLWYGGVGAGEGLRSVEVKPSPNEERVLYPAHRSPFIGPGRSSFGPSFCPQHRGFVTVPPFALPQSYECMVSYVEFTGPVVLMCLSGYAYPGCGAPGQ